MFTFPHEINIFKTLMRHPFFSHHVLEIWCAFYTYSSSHLKLATFKCSIATCSEWYHNRWHSSIFSRPPHLLL